MLVRDALVQICPFSLSKPQKQTLHYEDPINHTFCHAVDCMAWCIVDGEEGFCALIDGGAFAEGVLTNMAEIGEHINEIKIIIREK